MTSPTTPPTDRDPAVRTPTPIDAIAERYVDTLTALDPFGATAMGLPGHDHEIDRPVPAGSRGARRRRPRGPREARRADPGGRRRPGDARRDARAPRARPSSCTRRASCSRSSTSSRRPCRACATSSTSWPPDSVEGWQNVAARLGALPDAVAGYVESLRLSRPSAAGSPPGARSPRPSPRRGARRPGPVVLHDVRRGPRGGRRPRTGPPPARWCARTSSTAPPRRAARTRTSPGFLADELAPQAPEADAVGRERYALWSRYFLGADGRPRGDLPLGPGGAGPRRRRAGAGRAPGAGRRRRRGRGPRAAGRRGARRATRRACCAGPRRCASGCRTTSDAAVSALAGVHFDIPEPMLRPGVPHRPDAVRRHLLHRAERRLLPARAHVVVGAAVGDRVQHLAREDDRLPRGRPRPPPAGRPGGLRARHPQPLAPAGRAGCPGTARAGRCTPSASWPTSASSTTRATASACSTASACAPRGSSSTSACTSAWRRPPSGAAAPGPRRRPGRSCWPTSTCPRRSCASSSTATSAGPGRRRRTRSASGCGSRCATSWPRGRGPRRGVRRQGVPRARARPGVGRPRRAARRAA